jgi:hypothetical protein
VFKRLKSYKTLVFGVIVFTVVAAGCTSMQKKDDNQTKDQAITQEYYKKLSEKVPYPLEQMNDSIERRNLREKLLRFNKPDKLGYIYLLSSTGEVIDFYTVSGKISSTQSQMTVTDQSQYICQKKPWQNNNVPADSVDNYICEWTTTHSPGDDGSYGENETGIFWFDTNDVYHTWNGLYHYSDAPVKINSVTHRMEGTLEGTGPSSVGEAPDKRGK